MKMLSALISLFSKSVRLRLLALVCAMIVCGILEAITIVLFVPVFEILSGASSLSVREKIPAIFFIFKLDPDANFQRSVILLFLTSAVLAGVLRLLLTWYSYRTIFSAGADLGALVFERTLAQPYIYHTRNNSADKISRVDKVAQVISLVLVPAVALLTSTIYIIFILASMISVSLQYSMFIFFILGGFYFILSVSVRRLAKMNGGHISENSNQKIRILQESFGSIREIILEGRRGQQKMRYWMADSKQKKAQAQNISISQFPKYLVESLAIIAFGVWGLLQVNHISSGENFIGAVPMLAAVALGAQRLLPHIQSFYISVVAYQSSHEILKDVISIFQLPTHDTDIDNHGVYQRVNFDRLILNNVGFRYGENLPWVLRGVNLTIMQGQRIGIVGVTGGGKSTLMDIILGLLLPSEGAISFNQQLLESENISEWRKCIASVPQTPYIYDVSIRENIALGISPMEIDDGRIWDILKKVKLYDFISSLPKGLATRSGERGSQMSGGQRQRLAVARALYSGKSVLVMDEATSALDEETERALLEEVFSIQGITILMISHRQSTLRLCDVVWNVANGVVEAVDLK